MGIKYKNGFTFIEILIVVGVIGLLLPALFAILFVIIQQQTKLYALQEVKREGDNTLSMIENTLKNNATAVYNSSNFSVPANQQCTTTGSTYSSADGTTFWLKDTQGNPIRFYLSGTPLRLYERVNGTDQNLMPTNLTITAPGNLISCVRTGTFVPPIISVQFTVTHEPTNTSLTYTTKIKLYTY